MIIIDDQFISDEILDVCFSCDLNVCKGACCVDGDEGAPLSEEEVSVLDDEIDNILPFMNENGRNIIHQNGVFDYGSSGEYVTPLVNDCECAFVIFENDIALCAIEKAYYAGKTKFKKPISCHLYPIRTKIYTNFEAVNYHRWQICDSALKNGKKKNSPIYLELKEPLIRKFGKIWYEKLLKEAEKYSL